LETGSVFLYEKLNTRVPLSEQQGRERGRSGQSNKDGNGGVVVGVTRTGTGTWWSEQQGRERGRGGRGNRDENGGVVVRATRTGTGA